MTWQHCFAVVLIGVTGCGSAVPAGTRQPTSVPSNGSVEFSNPRHGIRLVYPAAWSATDSNEFILLLVPKNWKPGSSGQSISLDIPKLPSHVPGLIPIGLVVNGYIDDLKKLHRGVKVEEPAAMKVAGVNARRVVATWQEGDQSRVEEAVLTVHGDRVYIFRGTSTVSDQVSVQQLLADMLKSVGWIST